jgi:hypothetical protein
VVAGLAPYGLHRLGRYAAGRGWIYYGTGPRRGNILGFEEVFQPSVEHYVEERASEAIVAHRPVEVEGGPDGYRDTDGPG